MENTREYTSYGSKAGDLTTHYGVTVDTTKPTTGVFQNNRADWLYEDAADGVDLRFEEWSQEHDPDVDEYDGEGGTVLIGFIKGQDGKWEPDPAAEYSAIVGEIYAQVVASRWAVAGAWCSPCYPGQGEPSHDAGVIIFSLPPDVIGDSSPEVRDRVYKLETERGPK